MSDKKISQLTSASTPLTGTEELAIVQSGATVKATAQDVADLAPAPSLGYLVYSALVSQTGTSNPTVEVIQNTLGITVSFTRFDVGDYFANIGAAPLLIASKTAIAGTPAGITSGGPTIYVLPTYSVGTSGPDKTIALKLFAFDSSGNSSGFELSSVPNQRIYLEIRVYP
jgi:hypothetical protein